MPPDLPPLVPPYYPIIYVRGYAFTQTEVNATTEDPYMGFNRGATKLRQQEYVDAERFIFEGPVVRLMKDYGYLDVYSAGAEDFRNVHPQSVIIYRYYEAADTDLGLPSLQQATIGDLGPAEVMEKRATDLGALIIKVRDGVCQGDAERERQFRVHLVAHSMGGLICRCLLQKFGSLIINVDGVNIVDKVFTYATPHNGIEVFGINRIVPRYFRRKVMRQYLALVDKDGQPLPGKNVNTLNGAFSPDRFFCLVGTDWRDYDAAGGLASLVMGEGTDGLVKVANATVVDARMHEVHRSHSGPHGIVNSEEGYQNLVRFLFGHLRIDGRVIIDPSPPPSPHGPVSLYTEATVAVVGSSDANLTERKKDQYSAVFQADSALSPDTPLEGPRLFSLSFPQEGPHSTPPMATVDLAISPSVPNGNRPAHLPNYFFFRKSILLNVDRETRQVSYAFDDQDAFGDGILNQARLTASTAAGSTFEIPLESANGFRGLLELKLSFEYEDTGLSRAPRGGFAGRDSNTGVAKKLEEDYVGMEG